MNLIKDVFGQIYALKKFSKQQWLSGVRLKKIQDIQFKKILEHSKTVPFYNELYKKNNIDLGNIKGIDDIKKIPFITKDDVRNNPENFVSNKFNIKNLSFRLSSGSSGHPTKIYSDNQTDIIQNAVSRRAFAANGVGLRDTIIIFADPSTPHPKTLYQKLGFLEKIFLDVSEKPAKQVERLLTTRGNFLYGYSSNLFIIAEYCLKNNIKLPKYKRIFATAEMLTAQMREKIEQVFDSGVSDLFGCQEFIRTAWECPKNEGYYTSPLCQDSFSTVLR